MPVFDYKEADSEENSDDGRSHLVSVCDSGVEKYTTYRMTIPKEIAEGAGIDENTQLQIESTETGFEAHVLDL